MNGAGGLEYRDFSFTYPGRARPALDRVSLAVAPGTLAVVAGRNGAGKSTLALAANGTIPHLLRGTASGAVTLAGRPVRAPRERAAEIGVVFQDFEAHLVSSTAALEIAFPLENAGWPRDEMLRRVPETLAQVGLAGFEDRVPAELSGGEKQRLAIAAAIALRPSVLVLDEPLTDLDPLGKLQVLDVVGRLRSQGIAVVMIEHDPQALLAADLLVVLDGGRVVYTGPVTDLLADPGRCAALGLPAWPPAVAARALKLPPGPLDVAAVAARIKGLRLPSLAAPSDRSGFVPKRDALPLIEFRNVTSGYPGGGDAMKDLTFTIRQGECLALLGQNGSGKTALAKHAVGLIRPRVGALDIKGRPGAQWILSDRSRVAGYVFQNPDHQIFSDTVGEEAAFGARNLGLPENEVGRRVREALSATGLSGREGEDPFTLSKGERERLAVASLLAYRPEAVFFDEPTTGLDADEARRMMDFIRQLNADGMTVILITHAMWAAAEYADRIAVLAHGRLVLDGPAGEVFAREDVLAPLALAPPPAAALANRLGFAALDTASLLRGLGVEDA